MEKVLRDAITNTVMTVFGRSFCLDPERIESSLDPLTGIRKTVDLSVVGELSEMRYRPCSA